MAIEKRFGVVQCVHMMKNTVWHHLIGMNLLCLQRNHSAAAAAAASAAMAITTIPKSCYYDICLKYNELWHYTKRFDEPRHDACASLCRTTQKCKTLVPDEYVRFFGLFCVNKWVELATLFNPFESRSFCRWFAHSFRLICMIFRKQLTHTHRFTCCL